MSQARARWVFLVCGVAALLAGPAAVRAEQPLMGSKAEGGGSSTFYVMDRATGAGSLVGAFVPPAVAMNGLAHDPVDNILYGISAHSDQLYRIDPATAQVEPIGAAGDLGFGNANGLAYDPASRTLFGSDNFTNTLFTIDVSTGVGTGVGTFGGGYSNVEGLGFDPAAGTLYGLAVGRDREEIFGYGQVLVVEPGTADATALGPALASAHPWRGLTFDPVTDKLIACGGRGLCLIDKESGEAGPLTDGLYVQGLAVIPEPATLSLLIVAGLPVTARRVHRRHQARAAKEEAAVL